MEQLSLYCEGPPDTSWLERKVAETFFFVVTVAVPALSLAFVPPVALGMLLDVRRTVPASPAVDVGLMAGGAVLMALWPWCLGHLLVAFERWQQQCWWSILHAAQWQWGAERIAKRRDKLLQALGAGGRLQSVLVEGRLGVRVANVVIMLTAAQAALLVAAIPLTALLVPPLVAVIVRKSLSCLVLGSLLLLASPDVFTSFAVVLYVGYSWGRADYLAGTFFLPWGLLEIVACSIVLGLIRRIRQSWLEHRKARYLLATNESLRVFEATSGLGLSTTKVDATGTATVACDAHGIHLGLPLQGGGRSEFVLQTNNEVFHLAKVGPQGLQLERREGAWSPLVEGRLAYAVLVLVTVTAMVLPLARNYL